MSSLRRFLKWVSSTVGGHAAGTSIIFGLAIAVVALIGFMPVDVYYTVKFDNAPADGSNVSFVFEADKDLPPASVQTAEVNNKYATIRLNPLNAKSKSLQIETFVAGSTVHEFTAEVMANGRHLYSIKSIPGSELQSSATADGTVISLSKSQLTSIYKASRFRSEIKLVLLAILLALYLLVLAKITVFRKLPAGYYISGVVVLWLIAQFLVSVHGMPPLANGYPYKHVIAIIVLATLVLIAVNYWVGRSPSCKNKKIMSLIDYAAVFGYAIYQPLVYERYLGGFPDENAHLSYIVFLKKTGGFVPDFKQMNIYVQTVPGRVIDFSQSVDFNYLGHPPLYYWIMDLLGNIRIAGDKAYFDINQLRAASLCIGLLAIALIFYLGFSRIPQIPELHLLYALLVISSPNLLYVLGGLNNDVLTLLTVTIFIWGMIRFMEERYDWRTFLLITIGISASLMAKLTAGLMVLLMTVGVVAYTLATRKRIGLLRRPSFYASTPIYLVPIAYFVALKAKYNTIQPSYQQLALARYLHSPHYVPLEYRASMTPWQYISYWFTNFLASWSGVSGQNVVQRPSIYSMSGFCTMFALWILLFLPLGVLLTHRGEKKTKAYLSIGVIAIWVTVLYQCYSAFGGFSADGYLGSFQSRYYLCAISLFAFANIWLVMQYLTSSGGLGKHIISNGRRHDVQAEKDSCVHSLMRLGKAVVALYTVTLVLDGFVFSYLCCMPSIS